MLFWKFQFYNITRTEKSNQKIKTKYSSSKQSNTLATYDNFWSYIENQTPAHSDCQEIRRDKFSTAFRPYKIQLIGPSKTDTLFMTWSTSFLLIFRSNFFWLSRGKKILIPVSYWSFQMTPCNEIAFDGGDRHSNLEAGCFAFFLCCCRTKARFRRRTFHESKLIHCIKYMKSSASKSIRNACFKLKRLSRSFRLAWPGISPLERLWNGFDWDAELLMYGT